MTNEELERQLQGLPPTAKIYTHTDHGQCPERAWCVSVTDSPEEELAYFGDDLPWQPLVDTDIDLANVTAIMVG